MKEKIIEILDNRYNVIETSKSFKVPFEIDLSSISFPKLEGSEKQIAWANNIKKKNIMEAIRYMVDSSVSSYSTLKKTAKDTAKYKAYDKKVNEQIQAIVNYINEVSAKRIIDSRDENIICKFDD